MSEKFDFSGLNCVSEQIRREKEKKKSITRRKFLKTAVAAGAGLAAFSAGFKKINLLEEPKSESEPELEKEKKFLTEEQDKIEEENEKVVGKTIQEQLKTQDRITLDEKTKEAIYLYWYRSYSPGGENYKGLIDSLERMEPWLEKMKKAFKEEFKGEFESKEIEDLEKYIYLSIPESHFEINAESRKDAKGPFQFMETAAKECNLLVDGIIDERLDPEKSAAACACHLKKGYENFNNDWKLALANYNGGFAGRYDNFRTEKKQRNYADYLKWREKRLNEFISQPFYEHKITKEDKTLFNLAEEYGLSVEKIKAFNGLKSDKIKIGQTIKLPPEISVKMRELRDSLENLNYPEKFYAAWAVIEKNGLDKKYKGKTLKCDSIKTPKSKVSRFETIIGKGEGIFLAARKIQAQAKKTGSRFNLSVLQIERIIQAQNKIIDPKRVRPGQKISVELVLEGRPSLLQIARAKGISLEEIKVLNPSILNSNVSLPENIEIRIPK